MAVPKITAAIGEGMAVFRQEILYKDYKSNSIPPSFLKPDSGGEWILWPIEIHKFRSKINTKFGQSFQILLFNKQYTLLYALLSYLGQTKCRLVASKCFTPVKLYR